MNKSPKLSNTASLPQSTGQRSEMVACEPFAPLSVFMETAEYRRFVQVCEATRRYRYISVCVGSPGVGKTKAAHRYAQWDLFGPLLSAQGMVVPPSFASDCPLPRTALYTPRPTATPKSIEQDLVLLQWGMQMIADAARSRSEEMQPRSAALCPGAVDLLVVDEVERCSHISLEVLRDLFDRYPVGLSC
ncbi:MAG: AAA family ATPase [Chloroflexi bacterium]|nr:AAA family ATPase [Chloroflexota bacterium]